MERQARYYTLTAGFLLVLALCAVLMVLAFMQDRMLQKQTYEQAAALFNLILTTREWNAKHGGVFVEMKPGEFPNPYLEDSEIIDTRGRVFTKKNPAMMTREISEYAVIDNGFSFHITGLRLKNPDNVPDPWEKEALEAFDRGETERLGVMEYGSRHHYRLMRPLTAEQECLACHRGQGYQVGDVMGGISVNVPFDDTLQAIRSNYIWMAALSAALMLFFGLILYFFIWRRVKFLACLKLQVTSA